MVSAVDGAGKEHCIGRWRSGDGVAVDGECGHGAGKEHGRGCWRSGSGVAVDGECCGDGAGKEHGRGCWKLRWWSCNSHISYRDACRVACI